ncbi:MAG: hypothetical protein ACM3TN_17325 [Alphaproteobacteria bacterium]
MKFAARLAALLLLFASPSALAGQLADVQILNRSTGERLPVYYHRGKMYVAGNPGDRYAVQVANRAGARILAVNSVDGVNVISGETASYEQTGYVFLPWQSYEITGWRKNQNEVAAFYFTSLSDSYAARTDRPQNVGVIGVAVFRERTPPQPQPVMPTPRPFEKRSGTTGAPTDSDNRAESRESASGAASDAKASPARPAQEAVSAPSAALRRSQEKLGTGHGEREHSYVSYTDFRRASSHPDEIFSIYYDSRENLLARGIIPGAPRVAEPRPFPGLRFVPDPPS